MHVKHPDLISLVLLGIVAVVLAVFGVDNMVLRTVVGGPLVLIMPGYALTHVAFPARTIGRAERVALSLGLSLIVGVLGGFVLNWLPGGLTRAAWTSLLSATTVGASLAAFLRRRQQPPMAPQRAGPQVNRREWFMLGTAAIVVVLALSVARAGAESSTARFTQLWLLPADVQTNRVRVGINNAEGQPIAYQLKLEVSGQIVQTWPSIVLNSGAQWEATVAVAQVQPAQTVKATLYRLDNPADVYRWTQLQRN